ncbi:long-chain-fatty-acid--CoA ligase [Ponticaulis sp.]|uniref:long-chain-fatty-acid--CoA ligase n=1 Tax=Ponticaulis sp. TaxID=2020902 RepID=UPI000B6E7D36|nr:long-chain-fatty-acid--CoA ligase [Ponticaulis sp.]MAJ08033.1 acyl-CoA synthetase [Ponticaulis sp.]RPG18340.1 MAG: long-chain-fatty-acid--CoA ligase [Hyphomonadaceae bacterium TMED125]HBJ94064.1 acyl-CoA synthetase [Hyphomonadaceae bacterium]|tara:strand:+ start:40072 stop:41640 length:1569 start_codon:yes stop_codon:yes gene_type:complete
MIDIEKIGHFANIPRYAAETWGDATAFWFEGRETSFNQTEAISNKIANSLLELGVQPGERVCYLGKNTDYFYMILWGTVKVRGAMTGINNRLAAPEFVYAINDSGASTLFVTPEFFDVIAQIQSECPKLKNIVCVEGEREGWLSYDRMVAEGSDAPLDLPHPADDDVVQLYTSGTTGFPKGVQLTGNNYMGMFGQLNFVDWAHYDAGEAVMNAMPLFHVAGVNFGIFGMVQGAEVVILREIIPQEILKLVEGKKINHAFWVPAVILMLTQLPEVHSTDFSSLKRVSYGASPIAEDLLKQAIDIMGCKFTQLYGLTETAGAATYLPSEAHDPSWGKLRSCGVPWPGAMVRTVDGDGNSTQPHEVGEIVIKSNFVMKGYWNKPDATVDSVRDGWFYTGDAGYFDEDGFLYIHDRVKDMIVSGGENVYPAEVENAIFSHPGVADVAVIGIPSDQWGEEVKAIVVKAPGEEPAPEDIIAFTRERIAAYKAPKSVDFIEALPRNPSGKILRKDLREPYWEGRERRVS